LVAFKSATTMPSEVVEFLQIIDDYSRFKKTGDSTINQISQTLVSTKKIVFDIKAFGQYSGWF